MIEKKQFTSVNIHITYTIEGGGVRNGVSKNYEIAVNSFREGLGAVEVALGGLADELKKDINVQRRKLVDAK